MLYVTLVIIGALIVALAFNDDEDDDTNDY
jgi:hypothetical protein